MKKLILVGIAVLLYFLEFSWWQILGAIIGIVLLYLLYLNYKGNKDIANVEKYGGLEIKYAVLIQRIMDRNPFYQLINVRPNNVRLVCTGTIFRLIEMDKKLQIVWNWHSLSGKKYVRIWYLDEFGDQNKMYEIIDKELREITLND